MKTKKSKKVYKHKNDIKKKMIISTVMLLFLFVFIAGASYAVLTQSITSEDNISIKSGTFLMNFTEGNEINLNNAYPMTDEEGLNTDSYDFEIENVGNVKAKYTISLEDKEDNTLDKKYVKYSIKKDNGEYTTPVYLSESDVLERELSLDAGEKVRYSLKIWLDYNADNSAQGKKYSGRIVLSSVQDISEIDAESPIIRLNGDTTMTIEKNSQFIDPGVLSVEDNIDQDLEYTTRYEYYNGETTTTVNSVNTNNLGTYYIYYEAVDSNNNIGRRVRTVNVVEKTVSKTPVITLNGEDNIYLGKGEKYIEPGYSATDGENDITDKVVVVGSVNENVLGVYTIKYIVETDDGNTYSTTRTVTVELKESISISSTVNYIGGIARVNITLGTEDYKIKGYYISESEEEPDNSLFTKISETTEYTFEELYKKNGTFYVWAMDTEGNKAYKTLIIDQVDDQKPSCSFSDLQYIGKDQEATITLTCTDESTLEKNSITTSDFEANEYLTISSISQPTRVNNGYSYEITLTGNKLGTSKLSLKQGIVEDAAGNSNNKVESSNITVTDLTVPNTIELDLKTKVNDTIEVTGAVGSLSFESKNNNIVTVNQNGVLTAVGLGSSEITVTDSVTNIKKKVKVNVNKTITINYVSNGIAVDSIDPLTSDSTTCTIEAGAEGCIPILFPQYTVKSGYTALGWNTDENATTNNETTLLTDDTTFYTITKKDAVRYTATFTKNGIGVNSISATAVSCSSDEIYNPTSETNATCTINKNDIPEVTLESGYTFIGWNTDNTAITNSNDFSGDGSLVMTENKTYYSIAKKDISITFNNNDNDQNTETTRACTMYNDEASCDITTPKITPSVNTPNIIGWGASANAKVAEVDELTEISVSTSKTYYAVTKGTAKTYNISFYNNKYDGAESISCTIDATYNGRVQGNKCSLTTPTGVAPEETPVILGYSEDENATTATYDVEEKIEVTGNKTYYLISKSNPVNYSISYTKGNHVDEIGKTQDTCTIESTYNGEEQAESCNVVLPTITPDEGYRTLGWYDGNTKEGDSGDTYQLTQNKDFTAKATEDTYKLTINPNGGEYANSGAEQEYSQEFGTTKEISSPSKNASYQINFDGNDQGATLETTRMTAERAFDSWSLTGRGSLNGTVYTYGAGAGTLTATYNTTSNSFILPEISKTGYTCKWAEGSTSGTQYEEGTARTVTSDTTYYALCNINVYEVIYDYATNGGDSVTKEEENVTYGNNIDIRSVTATKDGYEFVGWNTNPNATTGLSSLTMGTSDVTLYAIYKKVVNIRYESQGNAVESLSSTSGSCTMYNLASTCEVTLPQVSVRTGYTFVGWNTDNTATTGTSSNTAVQVSTGGTYYTIVYKNAVEYTATFMLNGAGRQTNTNGDFIADNVVRKCSTDVTYNLEPEDDTCTITTPEIEGSTNTPIVLGYNSTSSSIVSNLAEDTELDINSDVTYYAITKKNAIELTANYNANGATLSSSDSQSCILSAVYNGEGQETSCNVTPPTITASANTPTIIGWSTDATNHENNASYNNSTNKLTLTSNNSGNTWYAQTTKNKVTYTVNSFEAGTNVTSIADNSSRSCEIAATYNGVLQSTSCDIITPEYTAKEGYTKVGWNTSKNSSDGASNVITLSSNVEKYYAHATANTYTIEYYDGITLVGSSSATVDDDITLTSAQTLSLTKTGYNFKGWSTSNGGSVAYSDGETVTNLSLTAGDIVKIYAVWNDEDKPICSFGSATDTTTAGTTTIELTCTDSGSMIADSSLSTDDFTATANGEVIGVSSPLEITNGYKYTLTLRGVSVGDFTTSLKAGVVQDNAGNTNNLTTSSNITVRGLTYTVTYTKDENIANIGSLTDSCTTTGSNTTCSVILPSIDANNGYAAGWYYNNEKQGNAGASYELDSDKTLIATGEKISYTITYNLDGGSATNPETYQVDSESITLIAPTKTGYTFTGWTGSNGDVAQTSVTIATGSTGDKEYTANYTKDTYTITYNLDGGSATNPETYQVDSENIVLTAPTKTGYTFTGWTGSNGDVAQTSVTIPAGSTGDKEYTANYTKDTYTITYNLDGGSATNPETYQVDSENIVLTAPTKTGYTFTGWTGSNGETAQTNVTIATGSTGNKEYTANYTKNTYTLTASTSIGSIPSTTGWTGTGTSATKTITYDNTYGTLPTPTATGYKFEGWEKVPNGFSKISYLETTGSQYINTLYYPKPTTGVYADFQFTEVSTLQQRLYGPTGGNLYYDFYINGNGKWAYAYQNSSGNWISTGATADTSRHKLNFNTYGNGKINIDGNAVINNAISGSPTNTASMPMTIFSSNTGSTTKAPDNLAKMKLYEFKIYESGSLVRHFVPVKRTSDSETETGLYETIEGKFYIFNSSSPTTYEKTVTTSSTVVKTTNSHTITAKWKANNYTLTLNPNGGSGSNIIKNMIYGTTNNNAVDVPTRTGYKFLGWYTAASGGEQVYDASGQNVNASDYWTGAYSSGTWKYTGDKTLYAQWKINSYTVTYNYSTNGGTSASVTSASVNYNSAISLTPTATKSGYTFVGWNTSSSATTKLSSLTMGTSNVTLYAIFKKTVTITFNANNNTISTESGGTVTGTNTTTRSCTAYNTATSCSITTPTITAPTNTPTIVGFGTAASSTSSSVAHNTSITVSSNTTYYAITRKAAVTYTYKFSTSEYSGPVDTSASYSNKTCTIAATYNGTKQGTTCSITLPTITQISFVTSGYSKVGWYKSGLTTFVGASGGTVSASSSLTLYPVIVQTIPVSTSSSGTSSFTVPASGTYKLQAWGAQGGTANSTYGTGGYGAYTQATVTLPKGAVLYYYTGGQGSTKNSSTSSSASTAGGYNGGGSGACYYLDTKVICGLGGGASHIASKSGLLSSLGSSNKSYIYLVAAGGGGSAYYNTSNYGNGGSGGGYKGGNGTANNALGTCYGTGATQTGGGYTNCSTSKGKGSLGLGGTIPNADGNSYYVGSSGGGGIYGGGAGGHDYTNGAGGGSGYNPATVRYSTSSTKTLSLSSRQMRCYDCGSYGSSGDVNYTYQYKQVSGTATNYYSKSGAGAIKITFQSGATATS